MSTENQNIEDDLNPVFIFSGTHSELLIAIANGSINAVELATEELSKRGLDNSGNFKGFL